jgi:hypothetical protein
MRPHEAARTFPLLLHLLFAKGSAHRGDGQRPFALRTEPLLRADKRSEMVCEMSAMQKTASKTRPPSAKVSLVGLLLGHTLEFEYDPDGDVLLCVCQPKGSETLVSLTCEEAHRFASLLLAFLGGK